MVGDVNMIQSSSSFLDTKYFRVSVLTGSKSSVGARIELPPKFSTISQAFFALSFGLVIATTGLAGPKSDRSLLPVGLCFIAVGTKEKVYVYRYKFDGDRRAVTEKAINYALFMAFRQLKNM